MVEKTFTTAFSIASDLGSVGAGTAGGALTGGGAAPFSDLGAGLGSTAARTKRGRAVATAARNARDGLPRRREGKCMAPKSANAAATNSQKFRGHLANPKSQNAKRPNAKKSNDTQIPFIPQL